MARKSIGCRRGCSWFFLGVVAGAVTIALRLPSRNQSFFWRPRQKEKPGLYQQQTLFVFLEGLMELATRSIQKWSWKDERCLRLFGEALRESDRPYAALIYINARLAPIAKISRNVVYGEIHRQTYRPKIVELFGTHAWIARHYDGSHSHKLVTKPAPVRVKASTPPKRRRVHPPKPPPMPEQGSAATPTVVLPDLEPLRFENGKTAGIGELTDLMCSWPIGDPQDKDFAYCARAKGRNDRYCPDHKRLAYQPVAAKRARKKQLESWQVSKTLDHARRTTKY